VDRFEGIRMKGGHGRGELANVSQELTKYRKVCNALTNLRPYELLLVYIDTLLLSVIINSRFTKELGTACRWHVEARCLVI
jgi:hypothetical protein